MAQQQIPWWWQFFQGQQPTPAPNVAPWDTPIKGGPPPGVRQQNAIQAQQYQQQFQNQPDLPPISQPTTTTAPEAVPGQELGSPTPSPTSFDVPSTVATSPPYSPSEYPTGAYGTPPIAPMGDFNVPGGYESYPAGIVPPHEGMTQPQIDQYLYNPTPDENVYAPQNQSYYGGGFNPEPDERMTANPVDQYLYNVPPDESMIPNNQSTYYGGGVDVAPIENMQWTSADQYQPPGLPNPAPNKEMIPTPIGPPSDTNQYFPAGDGGHYVYDENFQPQGYQAPPDQPENIPTPPGATPDVLPAEPVPPPFTREGSGMMGTWQDYANTFTNAPYQSPFDTVPTSGLYGGNPTPLAGSFAGLGGFDPGSLEGTPWSGVSAEGLMATLPWGGSVLFHSAPGYGISAPGSGQENLGFGSGHVSQLSVR